MQQVPIPTPQSAALTQPIAIDTAADTDGRWRAWQARGTVSDRRSKKFMTGLALLLMTALVVWLLAQFT
jgi:hypothetical protein